MLLLLLTTVNTISLVNRHIEWLAKTPRILRDKKPVAYPAVSVSMMTSVRGNNEYKKINRDDWWRSRWTFCHTARCCYNAIQHKMLLHTALKWLRHHMNHNFNYKRRPYTARLVSVYFQDFLESDCFIKACYCTSQFGKLIWYTMAGAMFECRIITQLFTLRVIFHVNFTPWRFRKHMHACKHHRQHWS